MTFSVSLYFLSLVCTCRNQILSLATPQWSVRNLEVTTGYCLLASGNFSLIFPPVQDQGSPLAVQVNTTWAVPNNASAQGVCGDHSSELNLRWLDEDTAEENLLNLVITKMGRLAGLTGVFTRLHSSPNNRGMREMSGHVDFNGFSTLVWPIRYGLSCPKSLMYPLYHAPIPLTSPLVVASPSTATDANKELARHAPMAYLLIENIQLEAFRHLTLRDQIPQSSALEFYRRVWECEFHMSFDWAPIAVSGGLASLIALLFSAFLCKTSLGCSDRISTRGYEKV